MTTLLVAAGVACGFVAFGVLLPLAAAKAASEAELDVCRREWQLKRLAERDAEAQERRAYLDALDPVTVTARDGAARLEAWLAENAR